MEKFTQVKEMVSDTLEMYVPIVARVHGEHHPEFIEVKSVYETLNDKMKQSDHNLDQEFTSLRKLTNHYEVPGDVCESYEAVYNMLEKLDKAYYHNEEEA